MSGAITNKSQELKKAFDLFNAASEQLSHSYTLLEREVSRLRRELRESRQLEKQQQDAAAEYAQRLQHLINALPAAVVVIDKYGKVIEANTTAADWLAQPLLGCAWADVIARNFDAGEVRHTYVTHRNGKLFHVNTRPMGNAPGQIVLIHDMTEIHQLEQALERSQRLSAMGEMVARIAHQIRTPLSTAMLYASHIEHAAAETDLHDDAGQLVNTLKHLDQMVTDMLLFSRGNAFEVQTLTATGLFKELKTVVAAVANGSVLDIVDRSAGSCFTANERGLLAALENLITNAVQAAIDEPKVVVSAETEGPVIRFKVSDNGTGMDAALAERVFEPFFTTKSHGTGLGLAVVKAIAEAHHGRVYVMPGEQVQGCTMVLELPTAGVQNDGTTAHPIKAETLSQHA